jgi:hypothetical protein
MATGVRSASRSLRSILGVLPGHQQVQWPKRDAFYQRDSAVIVALDRQRTQQDAGVRGGRTGSVVALGHLAGVTGGQQEMGTAVTGVGSRQSEIQHPQLGSLTAPMIGPGGTSIRIGPTRRSTEKNAYGVSEVGVKTICLGLPRMIAAWRLGSNPSATRLAKPTENETVG